MRAHGLLQAAFGFFGMAALSACVGAPIDEGAAEGEAVASAEQALPTDGQVCITVQQGASGAVEDATIWQSASDWNDGAGVTLSSGSSASGGVRQSLIRYDLSGVPAGASLLSASMSVFQQYKAAPSTVSVHQVTSPWAADAVTWDSFAAGYDPAPVGSFVASGDGAFRSVDLLALAQGWVDGATPNHGVLLDEPASDRTNYRSSENVSAAERPKMEVCYVTCDDGTQNGDETGLDCGGSCAPCCGEYFSEDFSSNAQGWTLGPEWQIGAATPSSGGVGNPDPAEDHTPTSDDGVAGVVIGGNASTSTHGFYYLTSPVIDAASAPGPITLSYHRWLNSDYTPYMQNRVEVWNGASWVVVWQSGSSPAIRDQVWTLREHDLTPYKSAGMRVRFGFNVGSAGVFSVSSWNLDDVSVHDGACSP